MSGYSPSFRGGDWKVICDVSGRTIKASQSRKRWDNAIVAKEHWEPRHPQDYVRGVQDEQSVPFSRPDQDNSISAQGETDPFPGTGVPTAPSLLAATSLVAGQVVLTWADNSTNETGFVIERKFTNSSEDPQQNGHLPLIASVGVNIVTFTNTGLTSGQSFDYQVAARNASGLSTPSDRVTIVVL